MCAASELLRMNKAKKISVYATHGLFTEGTDKLLSYLDKIYVSNTHNIKYKGIDQVDVSPVFGKAIYRAQKGLSISGLFE